LSFRKKLQLLKHTVIENTALMESTDFYMNMGERFTVDSMSGKPGKCR
jgi:hypothetical protein